MNLKQYIHEKRQLVNDEIARIFNESDNHPLSEVYSYCMSGGKRFRPMLVIGAAEACNLRDYQVLPAAISVELIHNFSLIHDDLPCMDNDVERRGMPTCHAKYGTTEALLAGDGLIIFAFEILAKNAEIEGIQPESVIRVLKLFARAAGHQGMTGGQVLDMRYQHKTDIDPKTLEKIHRKKTGALITASVVAGGILASAPGDKIRNLEEYGENIGLTYQIIDDVLDFQEDKQTVSFPSVFGPEESIAMAKKATTKAVSALKGFDEKADPLRDLAWHLLNRNK